MGDALRSWYDHHGTPGTEPSYDVAHMSLEKKSQEVAEAIPKVGRETSAGQKGADSSESWSALVA